MCSLFSTVALFKIITYSMLRVNSGKQARMNVRALFAEMIPSKMNIHLHDTISTHSIKLAYHITLFHVILR